MLFTAITAFIWTILLQETPIGEWLCLRGSSGLSASDYCSSGQPPFDPRIPFSIFTALVVSSGIYMLNRHIRISGNWLLSLAVIFVVSYFERAILQSLDSVHPSENVKYLAGIYLGPILIGIFAPVAFHHIRILLPKSAPKSSEITGETQNPVPSVPSPIGSKQIKPTFSSILIQFFCAWGAFYAGAVVLFNFPLIIPKFWTPLCGLIASAAPGYSTCLERFMAELQFYSSLFTGALFAALGCIYIGALLRLRGTWIGALLFGAVAGILGVLLPEWLATLGTYRVSQFLAEMSEFIILFTGAALVTLGYHLTNLFRKRVAQELPTET